ncbi:MAG: BMP family ABC transporter substrate-binding protein [Chloroflexi bacterium]|nr:MAG: BMP family ABC transporter substrate-binding protein [Chloroflexota bacterium]
MKSKSTFFVVTLMVLLAMILGACQSAAPTATDAPTEEPQTEPEANAPAVEEEPCLTIGALYVGSVKDAGFNQAMHESVMEVKENISCVKIIEAENIPEGPDAEKTMQTMIDQGAKLIFPTSFGHQEPAYALSEKYPDVIFEHVGGYMMGPNFANFFGKPPETFYIMGAAAGMMTKSNKLGFIGAFPIGWSVTFINAFELGAQSTNPDAETIVSWTFSWSDSAKEAAATDALINQGVDVITMHVDSPTTIVQTAESRSVFSIGYQSVAAQQFAPEYWLSGVGFTLGGKMTWMAQTVIDDTWEPIFLRCGVADSCMEIAPFGPKVSQEVQDEVNSLVEKLNAGELTVFAGPIVDQEGTERVAEGATLSDEELGNVDWFVKGITGSPK